MDRHCGREKQKRRKKGKHKGQRRQETKKRVVAMCGKKKECMGVVNGEVGMTAAQVSVAEREEIENASKARCERERKHC